MVLHCIRSQASLLLLVAPMYWFFCWTTSQRCHVRRFGQSQAPPTKQRYIPRHLFTAKFDNCVLSILPAFHSLTGSDSTSFLAGHTKKSCWNILEHYNLLSTLGKGVLSDYTSANTENFIMQGLQSYNCFCWQYSIKPFCSRSSVGDALPNARCSILSRQAGTLPSISVATGWQAASCTTSSRDNGMENWKWYSCTNFFHLCHPCLSQSSNCSCITQCRRRNCSCKKTNLPCTAACRCKTVGDSCKK